MKTIATERLVLRAWRIDDAPGALEMYGDPRVTQYIGGRTQASVHEMRAELARWIERGAAYPAGQGAWCALRHGAVIGCGLLKPLRDRSGGIAPEIEVGWHLARAHWGQGYATEIGRALVDHGLHDLGLRDLHCVVEPPNEASKRVAERLGFTHVGRTTAFYEGIELEHYRWMPS